MLRKIFAAVFFLFLPGLSNLEGQIKPAFTGDPATFHPELVTFMGPNLSSAQRDNLDKFLTRWDSSAFTKVDMSMIVDISSQMSARLMRPVPHFNDFIQTINYFVDYKREASFFNSWLRGLSEITFNPRISSDNVIRYFRNTGLMIKENVLSETGSVIWKVKGSSLKFEHDTLFFANITNATLVCYSQTDSTEIYNVTGTYYPEVQLFKGKKGTVTWEKAGFNSKDVYADINDYIINTSRNTFTVDSARFTNKVYFKNPELGQLTDHTTNYKNVEKETYPRFSTYTKEFKLTNIFKGVNYEGGLEFEGANVKGLGGNYKPAKITLYRNDTLSVKVLSQEFGLGKTALASQESAVTIYLKNDSIYHSNLGFSYLADTRQLNLFRTNNPISKSPYYNTFHRLDMYFEYLSWNLKEPRIIMSRARGASISVAQFESVSFFKTDDFFKLMGLDNYHPLNRLIKFSEFYYSSTFPIAEFAKWMHKPVESVTGMCIDLANKGFIFYNRNTEEVTIKKKTHDFIDFYAKKLDYDVLTIFSETKAPVDNAVLNLSDYKITVNGVRGIVLSDSQKVAIFPYNRQIVIGKNRSLEFDGVVDAGLFTVFGHKFSFNYDTFNLRLKNIDSISVAVETDKKDVLRQSCFQAG